jgi:uncharacterized membrane protein
MNEQWQEIRRNMVTGIFLAAPVLITLWILNIIFTFLTDFAVAILPEAYRSSIMVIIYRLAAFIILLLGLYLIGLLTRNIFGKSLYKTVDNTFAKLPVVGAIYKSVRQVSESIFTSRNTMFREVVLVEFPSPALYSIGFVIAPAAESIANQINATTPEETITVFVPTAPNPTTGFLLFLKRNQLKPVSLSVADAMKMIMSVGTVSGKSGATNQKSLLDHVEQWTKRSNNRNEANNLNNESAHTK